MVVELHTPSTPLPVLLQTIINKVNWIIGIGVIGITEGYNLWELLKVD